jgi:hypothetical protein
VVLSQDDSPNLILNIQFFLIPIPKYIPPATAKVPPQKCHRKTATAKVPPQKCHRKTM